MSVTSCISWILLAIITATIAITLLCKYPAWDSEKKDSKSRLNKSRHEKWFYVWLIGLSALGGFWALFLPLALSQKFDGPNADGNQLRLHLLYITGGVLALTTLGETHRKNTLEEHKNDQDHTRQVHAERRSRYTTAIEQLSSDKASIRLGGIYSLVGLVDEWLADEKTIPKFEERHKEGQVIINNLCAYIRSPFLLAEQAEQLDRPYAKDLQKDFKGDKEKFDTDKQTFKQHKAILEEEREIRQSIIKEIHERLQDIGAPGPWSKFDYDFSNTLFFYSTNFMFSHFGAFSNFTGATFVRNTDFSLATFAKDAGFFWVTFAQSADFPFVTFAQDADFSRATFAQSTDFSGTIFENKPKFEYTLDNKTYKARFSYKVYPENYNFNVSSKSPYKIETEEQEHNGVKFIIPKGTELFDPDDPSN